MALQADRTNLAAAHGKRSGRLYEKKDGENTLDYWAGYAPNPDDTKRLQQR